MKALEDVPIKGAGASVGGAGLSLLRNSILYSLLLVTQVKSLLTKKLKQLDFIHLKRLHKKRLYRLLARCRE